MGRAEELLKPKKDTQGRSFLCHVALRKVEKSLLVGVIAGASGVAQKQPEVVDQRTVAPV